MQQGANAQYLRPFKIAGNQALFTAGGNLLTSQINVGLYSRVGRDPTGVVTRAHVHIANSGVYVQQGLDLWQGRLHIEGGLRFDYFRFRVRDVIDTVNPPASGTESAGNLQPKFTIVYTPTDRVPATVYFNYGRGINSQDARGIVQQPDSPRVATTDFHQLGTAYNQKRLSLSADVFLIDHSNEQVYIPDDGTFEFKGPSRAYGYEVKTSVRLAKFVAFNGGITQIMNAFFRGTTPREYVDSAPHTVADAGLTLDGFRGFTASLRYRHTGNYRLDPLDPAIRASGLDVIDFAIAKRIRRWVDFDLSIDNLTNNVTTRLRTSILHGCVTNRRWEWSASMEHQDTLLA